MNGKEENRLFVQSTALQDTDDMVKPLVVHIMELMECVKTSTMPGSMGRNWSAHQVVSQATDRLTHLRTNSLPKAIMSSGFMTQTRRCTSVSCALLVSARDGAPCRSLTHSKYILV